MYVHVVTGKARKDACMPFETMTNLQYFRSLHEGPKGVGPAAVVLDGWDLRL